MSNSDIPSLSIPISEATGGICCFNIIKLDQLDTQCRMNTSLNTVHSVLSNASRARCTPTDFSMSSLSLIFGLPVSSLTDSRLSVCHYSCQPVVHSCYLSNLFHIKYIYTVDNYIFSAKCPAILFSFSTI